MKNSKVIKGLSSAEWKPIALEGGFTDLSGLIGIEELINYNVESPDKKNLKRKSDTLLIEGDEGTKTKKKKKLKKKKLANKNHKLPQVEAVCDDESEEAGKFVKNPLFSDRQDSTFSTSTEQGNSDDDPADNFNSADLLPWTNICVPDVLSRPLVEMGFKTPTEIQRLSVPAAIKGRRDILGAAETGSGKTLAFGLPIIYGIMKNLEKPGNTGNRAGDDEGSEFESDAENDVDIGCVKVANLGLESSQQPSPDNQLFGLVVTPTRELAIQIKQHLDAAVKYTPVKVAVIVGGMSIEKQTRVLKKRPHIVVGTPGRLWELISTGDPHLANVKHIKFLAIDETDRMIERDHYPELRSLLEHINADEPIANARQNFVFSATLTMTHEAPQYLKKKRRKKTKNLTTDDKLQNLIHLVGMKNYKIVDVTQKTGINVVRLGSCYNEGFCSAAICISFLTLCYRFRPRWSSSGALKRTVPSVATPLQIQGVAHNLKEAKISCTFEEKDHYLFYLLTLYRERTLVFCNSISAVRRLASLLTYLGRPPFPLHANMQQRQRLKNLDKFKSSVDGVLLATDVAARGLDIPAVKNVIHYQVPRTSEGYVHRSGRTARGQQDGLTILLIEPAELKLYTRICLTLKRDKDLKEFPIDQTALARVKERVKVGREIDALSLRLKKQKSQVGWLEKAAEEMDILIDDDVKREDMDNEEEADIQRALKAKKKKLETLSQTKPIGRPTATAAATAETKIASAKVVKPKLYKKKKLS